jgi:hypothetical protein
MGPVIACQNKYDLETFVRDLLLAEAERVAAIPSPPDPEMEHYPSCRLIKDTVYVIVRKQDADFSLVELHW